MPSTPGRSLHSSSSSRSFEHAGDSPQQLTPRSKVKALLADLDDDDSDKENDAPQQPTNKGRKHMKQGSASSPMRSPELFAHGKVPCNPTLRHRTAKASRSPKHVIDQTSTKLVAGFNDNGDSHSDFEDSAYTRIKKRLIADGQTTRRDHRTTESLPDYDSNRQDDCGSIRAESTNPASKQTTQDTPTLSPTPARSFSRDSSPGLFVSPRRSQSLAVEHYPDRETGMESNKCRGQQTKSRLQQLVARKREERIAKEATAHHSSSDEAGSVPSPKAKKPRKTFVNADSEDDSDREAGRKLTQQARPTRKASKKAIEEMNRETQRLSRNMQLTHQAKTKTKFSTADFFKKMNFRQPKPRQASPPKATSSSPHHPDFVAEGIRKESTPPSSPPSLGISPKRSLALDDKDRVVIETNEAVEQLPTSAELLSETRPLTSTHESDETRRGRRKEREESPEIPRPSLKRFAKSAKKPATNHESDNDLEIVNSSKPDRFSVLYNCRTSRAKEPHSINALRALAHLNGNDKPPKRSRGSMNPTQLNILLRQRAREQAQLEKNEKIQALREKGVLVQTEEEKERDQMQLESMLDKARKEAEDLAKKEKEAAKRKGEDGAGGNDVPDSEDEDEEYQASDDGEVDDVSGSEEEEEEEEALAAEDEETDPESQREEADDGMDDASDYGKDGTVSPSRRGNNTMIDNEADEDQDNEEEVEAKQPDVEEGQAIDQQETPARPLTKLRRVAPYVIEDSDSDEDAKDYSQQKAAMGTPKASTAAAFGFNNSRSPAMALSQVFAGTMAETQPQDEPVNYDIDGQQDSLAFLRGLPAPDLPDFETNQGDETQSMVEDSQGNRARDGRSQIETQQDQFSFDMQSPTMSTQIQTQMSELPEPTQDAGFETICSPARLGQKSPEQASHSTVDTELLPSQPGTNINRRGRLRRRRENVNVSFTPENTEDGREGGPGAEQDAYVGDAFQIMRQATRKPQPAPVFDKERSEAKDMVEEQAEESDDEYAGLGGGSDEESHGEMDEDIKMINDEGKEKLNEREVAAFYADKERADDEKLIEKLYKDINNGGLRRKRSADLDLLDSDDEEEAMMKRRAAKQREFAKMRKALLADEKIGKIAENPRRQAFLKAIEDREEDDDKLDFLGRPEQAPSQVLDLRNGTESQRPLGPVSTNARKRARLHPVEEEGEAKYEENPQPSKRRANQHTKPTSLADIRTTLSEIIGEPEPVLDSQPLKEAASGDSSGDESFIDKDDRPEQTTPPPSKHQNQTLNNPRRTTAEPRRQTVIDRLSLKRANSGTHPDSNAGSSLSRLAFQAPSKASISSFKVPSLLRRATTNASNASSDSGVDRSTAAAAMGLGTTRDGVKFGGSKKSSVNYYVREQERKAKVEEAEKSRVEDRMRVGRLRRSGMGLGSLAGGTFG